MGWRYRKSINIGPFRINFSKKGIGYSVGCKGYRVTKKAGGGYRQTMSIPGTGISHVSETSGRRPKNTHCAKSKASQSKNGMTFKKGIILTCVFAFLSVCSLATGLWVMAILLVAITAGCMIAALNVRNNK